MRIASRELGPGADVLVVAEIGNNHDGSIRQAERLIEAAAEAGADAVKLQTHIADAEMLPETPTPPHFDEPRYEFTKRMELTLEDHRRLKDAAESQGLLFFSSPFSTAAVELLEEVGVPAYKIASGEVTNPPLLEAVAATGKPVLLSSGMSGLDDVVRAAELFRAAGLGDVEEGSVAVTVRHATFDEWWHPYTLGVGPAGVYVAGLDDEQRERLRSLCAERFPRAPFDVDARAWAARGVPPGCSPRG